MYCIKCGTENPEGVKLCQSCSWVMASTSTNDVAEDAKTSGLAITALVLMILAFLTFGLTALLALIFGIIALVKIEKSNGQLKGKGFAIAGIAAPVVIIPIMLMILAISMPAIGRTKNLAEKLVCATNLKGLGTAMNVYAFDYDDKFPTGAKWCDLLIEHADVGPQSLVCPGAFEDKQCNYAMNENVGQLGASGSVDIVLLFETASPGWNVVGGKELLSTDNHKGDGCNVLFMDGHCEFVRTQDLDTLRWSEEEPARKRPMKTSDLDRTKLIAQRLVCRTNLHAIATATSVYRINNNDDFPTGDKWCDLLIKEADIGQKPPLSQNALDETQCHYAMNENAERLGPEAPLDIVLYFETSEPGWNVVGGKELLSTDNHKGWGCTVAFVDGSVQFITTENLDTLRWK